MMSGQCRNVEARSIVVSKTQLKDLMENRGRDAVMAVDKFGGIDCLCKGLGTDSLYGLDITTSSLNLRKNVFGNNSMKIKPPKTFIQLIVESLKDLTLIMLEIAAIISLALSCYKFEEESIIEDPLENWYDCIEGITILISVGIVVVVTAANNYTKERQFRGLQSRLEAEGTMTLLRNGEIERIPIGDIVVGDIVLLKYGDVVPADGCLIGSHDLKVDESMISGESGDIKKSVGNDPILLGGTQVIEGKGRLLVLAVGINTQQGRILDLLGATSNSEQRNQHNERNQRMKISPINRKMTSSKSSRSKNIQNDIDEIDIQKIRKNGQFSKSVLHEKLNEMALRIGYFGFAASTFIVLILIIQFSIKTFLIEKKTWSSAYLNLFIKYVIVGITLLVVAIPEGLPLAVTVALTYSVKRMMKDNNLVRHLDACETMGNATAICSDKTGTLTTNRMTVVEAFLNQTILKHFNSTQINVSQFMRNLICEGISTNTSYTSAIVFSHDDRNVRHIGNKTECALLGFVTYLRMSFQHIRCLYPEHLFIRVFTFNSNRKYMATVIMKRETGDCRTRVHVKGAPEILLSKCKFIIGSFDTPEVLTSEMAKHNEKIVQLMAVNGLRTICLAYRDFVECSPAINQTLFTKNIDWEDEQYVVSNLTFIGILGIEDPVREEVPYSVTICQRAGITVRMVTGDNVKTARSIAYKCNIVKPGHDHLILTSKEFNDRVRDENGEVQQHLLDRVWPQLRVLARSSPTDKYILVKGIIESKLSGRQEIVAVTGDGTNDGPALKKADVGFAMGIAGTDVAKEASDIILTDDNFSSIIKAIMWGRNVYDSISKFLQFQLTVNCVAVIFTFISSCIVQESPLRAVQMLWVNLIMDTLASLALATEVPTKELLLRKPYGRTKPLLSHYMLKCIILHALYQLCVTFTLLFFGAQLFDLPKGQGSKVPTQHFTMIFNSLVIMTLFNEINVRKLHGQRNIAKGLLTNPVFNIIWILSFSVQILIVEYGSHAFKTKSLNGTQWMWCILLGVGTLAWHQLVITIPNKWIYRVFELCCFAEVKTDYIEGNTEAFMSSQDSKLRFLNNAKRSRTHWCRILKHLKAPIQFIMMTKKRKPLLNTHDSSSSSDSIESSQFKVQTISYSVMDNMLTLNT